MNIVQDNDNILSWSITILIRQHPLCCKFKYRGINILDLSPKMSRVLEALLIPPTDHWIDFAAKFTFTYTVYS